MAFSLHATITTRVQCAGFHEQATKKQHKGFRLSETFELLSTTKLFCQSWLFVRGFFLLTQAKHLQPGISAGSRQLFGLLRFFDRNFVAASRANVLVCLNFKLTTRTQVVKHGRPSL